MAIAIIERMMEEKIMLEQVMIAMNGGFVTLGQRLDGSFALIGKQFELIDKRFEKIEAELGKVNGGLRILKDRMDRIEFAVYQIQKELESFHDEMRGIHKVLDNLNVRLVRVEGHLGFIAGLEPA